MMTEEQKVNNLKKILYSMDELTENENEKAKVILKEIIRDKKVTIIERLKFMIKIKEQIVGIKIRKFYVGNALRVSKPEVYAQLINGNVHLTGGIETILKPSYDYFDNDMIEKYQSEYGFESMGNWVITKNFKTLRFDHNSDKRWKDDKSFEQIIE
jgi:hypothetical protein